MTQLSTDERDELAQSVRAACERLAPEGRVRAVAYDGNRDHRGFDADLWKVLCAQVGITAIGLPEDLGGAGYGASAQGVVAHELGRALAPVPFIASTVLATGLLIDLRDHDPESGDRLSALVEGDRTAAAALTGDGGLWQRSGVTLTAEHSGDGWLLHGTVRHVLNGGAADDLVVAAIAEGEPAVFVLESTARGVSVQEENVLDGTRPMATITFERAPATRLSGDGPVDVVIGRNADLALAVLSAEQVGPVNGCSKSPPTTRVPGSSSTGPSAAFRRSSTSAPTCWSTSNGPGQRHRLRWRPSTPRVRRPIRMARKHGKGRLLGGVARCYPRQRADPRGHRIHLGRLRTSLHAAGPYGRSVVRQTCSALGAIGGRSQDPVTSARRDFRGFLAAPQAAD